jgi:hypothetical protein
MKISRYLTWVKQGCYKTNSGVKMILELDKETGATVLSPLRKIK